MTMTSASCRGCSAGRSAATATCESVLAAMPGPPVGAMRRLVKVFTRGCQCQSKPLLGGAFVRAERSGAGGKEALVRASRQLVGTNSEPAIYLTRTYC